VKFVENTVISEISSEYQNKFITSYSIIFAEQRDAVQKEVVVEVLVEVQQAVKAGVSQSDRPVCDLEVPAIRDVLGQDSFA
jgi:hypothetical protein